MNPSTRISTERLCAVKILQSSLLEQKKLDDGLDSLFNIDTGIRTNQVFNFVYGVARHHLQLEKYLQTKFKKIPPLTVQLVLELALFELIYNSSAKDYAVVSEALHLLDDQKLGNYKGLVNAILRNFLRNMEEEKKQLARYKLLPDWILKEISSTFGKRSEAVISRLMEQRPLFICVNTNKISEPDFKDLMKDIKIELIDADCGSLMCNEPSILKTDAFAKGLFFVQDLASQMAVYKLSPQPGCRILDLCAAPGGKSIKTAIMTGNRCNIVAIERSQKRMNALKENLDRMSIGCIELVCKDSLAYEGNNESFDYVIVDPPCTSLGVIARHPDIIWNKGSATMDELSKIQKALLDKGFEKLKKGGKLLYSVCTFTEKETIGVINTVGFELLEKLITIPNEVNMDGHFIAIFRKDK